jgi:hypothetical protein
VPEDPLLIVNGLGLTVAETPTGTMVSDNEVDVLLLKVASPLYWAVMLSVAAVLKLVVKVATPEAFNVPVPRLAVPFRKVTVPVGVPPLPVTVAVKVILVPTETEAAELVRTVELAVRGAAMIRVPVAVPV